MWVQDRRDLLFTLVLVIIYSPIRTTPTHVRCMNAKQLLAAMGLPHSYLGLFFSYLLCFSPVVSSLAPLSHECVFWGDGGVCGEEGVQCTIHCPLPVYPSRCCHGNRDVMLVFCTWPFWSLGSEQHAGTWLCFAPDFPLAVVRDDIPLVIWKSHLLNMPSGGWWRCMSGERRRLQQQWSPNWRSGPLGVVEVLQVGSQREGTVCIKPWIYA